MNKSILIGCALSALIGCTTTLIVNSFTTSSKLVYVDSGKLLNSSKAMQQARSEFKQKAALWQANLDTLSSEFQNQLQKYEKESHSMTAKELSLSRELINEKQNGLTEYRKALSTKAQEEDRKMTTEVLGKINLYLKKYGEANGYKVILAATDYGNLAYADEELDITDEVLEGLNKEYAGR
jgi:outer membrane protein